MPFHTSSVISGPRRAPDRCQLFPGEQTLPSEGRRSERCLAEIARARHRPAEARTRSNRQERPPVWLFLAAIKSGETHPRPATAGIVHDQQPRTDALQPHSAFVTVISATVSD